MPRRAAEQFKNQLREWLERESRNAETISVAKHWNVYNVGDQDQTVYIVESGQIKLLMVSPDGRECLLDIYTAGDVFGELCPAGSGERLEIATAMVDSMLKRITCSNFRNFLGDHSLFDGFVQYLVVRIASQQEVIASLVTNDSEHRLGEALLMVARKLGKQHSHGIWIQPKITQEELSEMVGVTRPWISRLLEKFREHGLIDLSQKHALIIREEKLTAYLAERA